MFECSKDWSQQGDIGEARAIYEFTKLGYTVSRPLHTHVPYDLIVDKDGILSRVQVKTSTYIAHESTQTYQVKVSTSGGNTKINIRKHFDASLVDMLFVLTADDRCWIIPTSEITSGTVVLVGTARYEQYQITGWVKQQEAVEKEPAKRIKRYRPTSAVPHEPKMDKREVIPPFTKDELEKLLWEVSTTTIAKRFKMSDNGIARWAKKWNLSKPPRGYWAKQR